MVEETQQITKKDIQELLIEQTEKIEERLAEQTDIILSAVDEKIKALDLKFSEKFDKLTTTLDKFLNISQLKKIIQEKLGVNLA